MEPIKTIAHKGYTIKIFHDDFPENPRTDWGGNLGRMVCFHKRYDLGDKHNYYSPSVLEKYLRTNGVLSLPIYMYDHSGITINTTGFSCPWDSGQIGYIYTTNKRIREFFNKKAVSKKMREQALKILNKEVEVYDQFLTGEVYMYTVYKNDKVVDSCCGFLGNIDYVIECAKESVEDHFEQGVKESVWRV